MDLQSGLREHPGSRASRHETGRLCQNNQKGICFMHNFRKAALAGATAVAVATGSMSVAVADETSKPATNFSLDVRIPATDENGVPIQEGPKDNVSLKKEGDELTTGVTWNQFIGEWDFSKSPAEGGTPKWVPVLFAGGIFAMVSAVIGLIVGPLYNYIVHGL